MRSWSYFGCLRLLGLWSEWVGTTSRTCWGYRSFPLRSLALVAVGAVPVAVHASRSTV